MDSQASSLNGEVRNSDEDSTIAASNSNKQDVKEYSAGSKRNAPGSLLARIPFLRPNPDTRTHGGSKRRAGNERVLEHEEAVHTQSLRKLRSRRSSLRKAALLSLGKSKSHEEEKAQASEHHDQTTEERHARQYSADIYPTPLNPAPIDDVTPRASVDDNSASRAFEVQHQESTTSEESLPAINFARHSRQTPTRDEDEGGRSMEDLQTSNNSTWRASLDKYDQPGNILYRKRTNRTKSPLSALPIEPPEAVMDWNYAETERWGWVILILTWIVFVMGMGSCLDVWSWAWAVGKTPYAPPELEDDPTLPIVGYYPALIILTGVMAWIWVFTAWVGMKYFRHAKIS